MLASPGTVPMAAGAPLLNGLELAGPYMFLLIAVFTTLTGWGMLRMQSWHAVSQYSQPSLDS